jgi:pilus assembly protein CpaB
MRIVFALVLIFGVALAGGAVYFASQQFNANESRIAELRKRVANNVELIDVYVAAAELEYGKVLTKDDVKIIEWPANSIPETAFTSIEDLFGVEDEEEFRIVIRLVDEGEILLSTKVTNLGEDAGVASRLAKGMRAFTLRVDVASGVSGFLRPGNKVDIYWTGQVNRDKRVTKLIMEGISLIAIDQSSGTSTSEATVAKTVTVAVSAKTVASLAQAQFSGKLLLSLRGNNDETTSDEAIEVTQNDLLGITEVEEEVKIVEEICTIKTRKGADVIEVPIPCSN